MTREQLDEIERLCNDATVEPWITKGDAVYSGDDSDLFDSLDLICNTRGAEDAAFIAMARRAVPEFVEHLRECEAVIQTWRFHARSFLENCFCQAYPQAKDLKSPLRCARCKTLVSLLEDPAKASSP